MGNVGRLFCVALPFILTAASIICMLIVGLVGVTDNPSLYMFRVNTTNLEIDESSIASLLKITSRSPVDYHDASLITSSASDGTSSKATSSGTSSVTSATESNITAADLGLADYYDVNLWGYCSESTEGDKTCTKAKFDWAQTYLNTSYITTIGTAAGQNITLPSEISTPLDAFKVVTKWTEVVYVIAMVALGLELFVGMFSYCSRAISCVTYLVSGIATVAVIAAAAMVTAMSAVVIGAVEGSAKVYGVTGSINTSFLATAWLGAAFAIAASSFWLFSSCCCKRDHHTNRRSRHDDEKPFMPTTGSYAPLHDNHQHGVYNQQQYGAPRHQGHNTRSDLAYEPYSHSNV
ncbi:SUR7 protein [Xylariales sp. AK1849]|nr:SUR7 protein [Xylariales sp. AK1849]